MSFETQNPANFDAALGDHLDWIDRELAELEMKLSSRPFRAATLFVERCVLAVREGEKSEEHTLGGFMDYVDAEWFKIVYARTVAWYSMRYGKAMKAAGTRTLRGVSLVLGTAFRLHVPAITIRPATPGETIWMHYHDRVEDEEDSLSWIVEGPNMSNLTRADGMKARRLANEVAGSLRAIYVQLLTVKSDDYRVAELRDQVLPHLEHAAESIAEATPERLKTAQWHIQMGCELALKMLAQQRTGMFPESHNLFHLYDELPPDVPFPRHVLSRIPHWERMVEWRYGGGPPVLITDAFRRYRTALRIIKGAADAARRDVNLSRTGFLLKRAPFLHDDPEMFKDTHRAGAKS